MSDREAGKTGEETPDREHLYEDDAISLRPLVEALRAYGRVIRAAMGAVVVLFVVASVGTLLRAPTERIGSIQFRLLFDGAAENKYPNGTAFNPAEIVAAPVLTDVYESNNLERFGEYSDFKDAIFVLQSSPELQLLAYEYEARLAETRLTSVERAGIEEEFRRRRESLKILCTPSTCAATSGSRPCGTT